MRASLLGGTSSSRRPPQPAQQRTRAASLLSSRVIIKASCHLQHDPTVQQQQQEEQGGAPSLQQQQQPAHAPAEVLEADSTTVSPPADGQAWGSTSASSGGSEEPQQSPPAAAAAAEGQTLADKYNFFYTHVSPAITKAQPVQIPPPNPSTEPVRPFFNTKKYRPPGFLKHYAAPPGGSYNFISFLGEFEPNKGKFLAVGEQLDAFLTSYYRTVALANRRMFLAERYQDQPFKFYQELDFPWSLDPQMVLDLIPKVVAIVTQEVGRVYQDQAPPGNLPKALLSMRTIYKVHMNFPGINTMEAKAGDVRKAVINRCRVELSGQPPLDKLKAELVVQEHWQEAQDQLVQLQQLVQQLHNKGQHVPAAAETVLQTHRVLLASAQDTAAAAAASSSSSSPSQQPSLSQQPQLPLLQQQQQGEAAAGCQEAPQGQQQLSQQQQQQQQSQQQQQQLDQLDWESIVDFPHGSLRMLGSCKSPWMDGDPEWVTEKAYHSVKCEDGVWMRQPLTLAAVMESSIQLQEGELRVFEQTEEFLEVVFQAAQQREQVLAAKRVKRAAKKHLDAVQQLLQDPEQQDQPGATGRPAPASPEDKAAKAQLREQRRVEQAQRLVQEAAEKAQQQQKRAEALARLQAVSSTASSQPVLQRPGLVRPFPRPPPPGQPPQS